MHDSLEISQRKIILPSEAPAEVYKMFNELRHQINTLHPVQVELIEMALRLRVSIAPQKSTIPLLPRRKTERDKNKVTEL